MKKKISEILLQKDSNIQKVQFDTMWFYSLADMKAYLGETLSEVETITLPFIIDGIKTPTVCATLDDIERGRKTVADASEFALVKKLKIKK